MRVGAIALGLGLAIAPALTQAQNVTNIPEHVLPNQTSTPGDFDKTITRADLCHPVPGKKNTWTANTKARRHVTAAVHAQAYRWYGVKPHEGFCQSPEGEGCEVDHLISLELGGTNDISNLWPEPYVGVWNAHMKDKLENKLHTLVCSGKLPLLRAQTEISHDWIGAFRRYVGPG